MSKTANPLNMDKDEKLHTLNVLQHFSFSALLPTFNSLKWSKSNELIGLNALDQLIIFRLNVNCAITDSSINRKQWYEGNLRFSTDIINAEIMHHFNVGKLSTTDKSFLRYDFMINRKKEIPQFNHFDFAPCDVLRRHNLVAAITDDYCHVIFLQHQAFSWRICQNFSADLNRMYIADKWDKKGMENIDFECYTKRLASLATTCFCWHSTCQYLENGVQYQMFSALKTGEILNWRITLCHRNDCNDNIPECEATLEQTVSTDLSEMTAIDMFENILIVETLEGQIALFELCDQAKSTIGKRLDLWLEKDNMPCHKFCFNKIADSIEIVFHKINSLIRVRISEAHFTLVAKQQFALVDETIEILSLYNHWQDSDKYCATTINSSLLLCVTFPADLDSPRLHMAEIKIGHINFSRFSCLFGFDRSLNGSLMAVVSTNATFNRKSHFGKNVYVYICTATDSAAVNHFLRRYLIDGDRSTMFRRNALDYLFLFRHYFFQLQHDKPSFQALMHDVIEKLPSICDDRMHRSESSISAANERLWLLKVIRFVLKRYHEYRLLSPDATDMFDAIETAERKADAFLRTINKCILKQSIELIIERNCRTRSSSHTVDDTIPEWTCEQMVSLRNIDQQITIDRNRFYTTKIADRIRRNVESKLSSLRHSVKSIYGDAYVERIPKSQTLNSTLNKCPYCETILSKVDWNSRCHTELHPLDVCANSLLVIDPLQHDIELCSTCLESKLLRPRVWPNPSIFPFEMEFDTCFFCL